VYSSITLSVFGMYHTLNHIMFGIVVTSYVSIIYTVERVK